jgi:hypothetical protein
MGGGRINFGHLRGSLLVFLLIDVLLPSVFHGFSASILGIIEMNSPNIVTHSRGREKAEERGRRAGSIYLMKPPSPSKVLT